MSTTPFNGDADRVDAQPLTQDKIDSLMLDRVRQAAATQSRYGALRRILPGKEIGMVRRLYHETFRGATPTAADIRNLSDHKLHAIGETTLGATPGSFLDPREVEPNKAELAKMTADEKLSDFNMRQYLLEQRARREGRNQ